MLISKDVLIINFVIIVLSLSSYSHAAFRCADVFQKPIEIRLADPGLELTPDTFHRWDKNGWFYFKAKLYSGELSLKIYLVDFDARVRSSIRGSETFSEAIEHFGVDNIDIIQGRWYPFSKSNYHQFRKSLDAGLSPEDAAFSTWTGQQALKHGFKYVQVSFEQAKTGGYNLGESLVPLKIIEYIRADFYRDEPPKKLENLRTRISIPPPMNY